MDYVHVLTRALTISWRHKYLWLLALFAGEATTASFGFQTGSSRRSFNSYRSESAQAAWTQLTSWIGIHTAVLWTIGLAFAALFVVLFLVSTVANGALIKGSAEHDAERPFGLSQASAAGVHSFRPMFGLKLFAVVVYASLVIVIGGLGLMAVVLGLGGSFGGAVATGALALLLFVAAVPFVVVFRVCVLLGKRAIVLDGNGVSEGFQSAVRLIWRLKGRVALIWVFVWVAGAAASIVVGLAMVLAAVPIVALSVAAYFIGGWLFAIATGLGFGVAWLIVVVTLVGGVNAFTSTCWTVAYSLLDLQTHPVISAQPQPA